MENVWNDRRCQANLIGWGEFFFFLYKQAREPPSTKIPKIFNVEAEPPSKVVSLKWILSRHDYTRLVYHIHCYKIKISFRNIHKVHECATNIFNRRRNCASTRKAKRRWIRLGREDELNRSSSCWSTNVIKSRLHLQFSFVSSCSRRSRASARKFVTTTRADRCRSGFGGKTEDIVRLSPTLPASPAWVAQFHLTRLNREASGFSPLFLADRSLCGPRDLLPILPPGRYFIPGQDWKTPAIAWSQRAEKRVYVQRRGRNGEGRRIEQITPATEIDPRDLRRVWVTSARSTHETISPFVSHASRVIMPYDFARCLREYIDR